MRLTGGRLAVLVVGLPVMLAGAASSAFSLTGLLAHGSHNGQLSYPWHGGQISLTSSAGSIRVVTGDDAHVGVSYTEHYQLKQQQVSAAATPDGGITLTSKCPGGLFGNNCTTNYTLTVPASATLALHTGEGSIQLSGLTGSVTAHTGAGHVTLTQLAGTLDVSTTDGAITGTELTAASTRVSTGDGRVSLAFGRAPSTVSVHTGDGGVLISVPRGSGPYHVDASTGDGSTRVDVPTDPSGARTITVHSGDGSIEVTTG